MRAGAGVGGNFGRISAAGGWWPGPGERSGGSGGLFWAWWAGPGRGVGPWGPLARATPPTAGRQGGVDTIVVNGKQQASTELRNTV